MTVSVGAAAIGAGVAGLRIVYIQFIEDAVLPRVAALVDIAIR